MSDSMWDFGEPEEEIVCTECGELMAPKVKRGRYGTDADGNRGIEVTEVYCSICGAEIGDE